LPAEGFLNAKAYHSGFFAISMKKHILAYELKQNDLTAIEFRQLLYCSLRHAR